MKQFALDSNILTAHWQANQAGYDPATDPDQALAPHRVAAFRLSLYNPTLPVVVPTVFDEIEKIKDEQRRTGHVNLAGFHMHELLRNAINADRVRARAEAFAKLHRGPKKTNDCTIIAECEEAVYLGEDARIDGFVTLDGDLIKALRDHATVSILTPLEAWDALGLPRGTTPVMVPAEGHPLRHVAWWRW